MRLDGNQAVKRLVIYFFYDGDGVVDDYVTYFLRSIRSHCTELMAVCNGRLTAESRQKLEDCGGRVFVRENRGFDVGAYKDALLRYGWERLSEFDEVILCNHTIMGPVYPFSDMFGDMDARDLDFWGITKHHRMPYDPFGTGEGYTREHIQSHFIAVRRSLLATPEFRRYWETMPEITSYHESVRLHEVAFTRTFGDAGFRWEVYTDSSDLEGFCFYPLIDAAVQMVRDHRCPIFKRRSFFNDHRSYLFTSSGDQTRKLMDYLREHTDYDTDMIWANILRTCHMYDIKNSLNLDYVLPSGDARPVTESVRLALVMHEYFTDLIPDCRRYALSMPPQTDVFITTDREDKAEAIREAFEGGPWHSVKVIVIENRGRDVSSLLVGFAPYIRDYDLVCFMHDKKVGQLDWGIKGYAFSERCFENLLGSPALVSQILALYEREPRLGLLMPPPPNHADYYLTMGHEWGPNYEITRSVYDRLGLSVPMADDKPAVAPLGTMFWFRAKALEKLIDRGWRYEDFPQEPNQVDGTMLHAIERVYPYCAQQEGYYSAWVISDDYARTELTNLNFMLSNLNRACFGAFGLATNHGLCEAVEQQRYLPKPECVSVRMVARDRLSKKLPAPAWRLVEKTYHRLRGIREETK